jgi:LPXTG-site transpeptidase (sortase) family protein
MGAVVRQRKLPRKDIGSWLIILGYLVVVVSTVNIVQEWMPESASPETLDDLTIPPQGFIPYLDSAVPMDAEVERAISVFEEVNSYNSAARLPSDASWENQAPEKQRIPITGSENLEAESATETWLPEYLTIPDIGLNVTIVDADYEEVEVRDEMFHQWLAPDARTVGWQPSSASLGVEGNTVLIGHHNIYGEVFKDLEKLEVGDRVWIYSGNRAYEYAIRLKFILPEKYESVETRLENARWIQPTQDERLTLVTCWPYETNTHRMILVAEPLKYGSIDKVEKSIH